MVYKWMTSYYVIKPFVVGIVVYMWWCETFWTVGSLWLYCDKAVFVTYIASDPEWSRTYMHNCNWKLVETFKPQPIVLNDSWEKNLVCSSLDLCDWR